MAYIGVQPAEAYTSFAVQHFTTSATTSYTLDNSVANENEIALFINNVRQQPGSSYAYTASGTTLTLSAATTTSDTMYCVFIGKAVQTVTPAASSVTNDMLAGSIATSKLADGSTFATTNGITMANSWELTSSISTSSAPYTIASNLASKQNPIGGLMTQSSGVFSFPTTGIYQIISNITCLSSSSGQDFSFIHDQSTDGGSNFTATAMSRIREGTASKNNTSTTISYFDVTDTSQCQIKFVINGWGGTLTVEGGAKTTNFYFMRLGDT